MVYLTAEASYLFLVMQTKKTCASCAAHGTCGVTKKQGSESRSPKHSKFLYEYNAMASAMVHKILMARTRRQGSTRYWNPGPGNFEGAWSPRRQRAYDEEGSDGANNRMSHDIP